MHPMLNIAIQAARHAGKIINHASLKINLTKELKQYNDIIPEIYKISELAMLNILQKAYPGHLFYSKKKQYCKNTSDYQWIINPINGSANFVHGFQYYCISIALLHKKNISQSVIYDPINNDLFTASRGCGAFLNNRRIRVGNQNNLSNGLIGTNFLLNKLHNFKTKSMHILIELSKHCAGLRCAGSLALDLANIAMGRLDGVFMQNINLWNAAAGSLLVTEAGGLVGNYIGESNYFHSKEMIAANPKIYSQIINFISKYS